MAALSAGEERKNNTNFKHVTSFCYMSIFDHIKKR